MAVVGGCLSGIWGLQIRVEDIFGFESCSAEGFTRLEEFRDQRLWTFGFGIEFHMHSDYDYVLLPNVLRV